MSFNKNNKITRELFQKFCKKHKIDIGNYDLKNKEIYIYQSAIDELKDKSNEIFLHINFNTVELNDTPYYYKPHKNLYKSDEPDRYGYTRQIRLLSLSITSHIICSCAYQPNGRY